MAAVVYPGDGTAPEPAPLSPGKKALAEAEQHPLMAIFLVLILALAIGWLVHKVLGGSSTSSAAVPTTTDQLMNPTNPTNPAPVPGSPQARTGTIRASGKAGVWDKAHTGVPYRTAPGGGTLGYIPFGTSGLDILNGPVSGPLNTKGGSQYWDQISYGGQSGYVSLYDFMPDPTNPTNTGGTGSGIGSGGFAQLRTSGGVQPYDSQNEGIPLRQSPDPNAPVAGMASYGSHQALVSSEPMANGWWLADMGGTEAYLHPLDVVAVS